MNHLTVHTEDSFSSFLDLAASNDVEGFKKSLLCNADLVDAVGLWYGRKAGSKQVMLENKTPLMVASTYGSVDVLKLILSHSNASVNFSCGVDKSTSLHCAASGGSANAADVVKLLLSAGADPNCLDAHGHRPVDVIVVPPKLQSIKGSLEKLLSSDTADDTVEKPRLSVSINSCMLSSSSEYGSPPSPFQSSPIASKFTDQQFVSTSSKKEYPIDPSFPDIKNSVYSTDEFRMFSFKVRPCSRAYSHDWTECPFVHPGENARRRDPKKFHYSCVPCPEFRKGACRRADMCEYAHGVFECWLHPAQYRTRLCKDGTSCNRRVCFFAHTIEELRPLYVSTGSAVPSPQSSLSVPNVMDMGTAMSLFPSSPSALSNMSPSPFTQALSPSGNGNSHLSAAWTQTNVPNLHLPGSNLQSSRLRSSFSVRDIPPDECNMLSDYDTQQQILNDLTGFSHPQSNTGTSNCLGWSKTRTPTNLDEMFSAEISSPPRYSDCSGASVYSPSHKSAIRNQFPQQQSMLSPIKTNAYSPKNGMNTSSFSPKNFEHFLLQASFGGVLSPGRMSSRSVEPISPMGSRLAAFAQHDKHQQQLCSLRPRELESNNHASVVGSPINSWSNWGSTNGKLDWSVNGDELAQMQRSSPTERGNREEPDLSWVHSIVKEPPQDMMIEKTTVPVSGAAPSCEDMKSNSQIESADHSVIGAWLERLQLDRLVA